ncbi:MAG: hypothetical protein R3190_02125, partial [Thermoanaerobaculia bacterium]|nr:hypothetical protein [Thermoanaerobaculia bacterium]
LLIVVGIVYVTFAFTAPGLLPDFGMDPFFLGGGVFGVGFVLLLIDEKGRHRRRWKTGPLKRL